MKSLRNHSEQHRRRGAALVEIAFCFPIIMLLVLGSIEMSNGIFEQHSVRAAAHESARVAALGEKDAIDVQSIANQVLGQRGITDFEIDIDVVPRTENIGSHSPAMITHFHIQSDGLPTAGLDQVPRGNLMRLLLTATRPAGPLPSKYLSSTLSAQVFFVKEY